MGSGVQDLDFIEELRLRRWAREHYVPPDRRERAWHPVVHDEMTKRDTEKKATTASPSRYSPR
jgi:hypothetical protein